MENITGLLFSVEDLKVAAKQVKRLIEDAELRKRLSSAASLYIEKIIMLKRWQERPMSFIQLLLPIKWGLGFMISL